MRYALVMPDRLSNLLGVVALAAADRQQACADATATGSAASALVHLQAHPGGSVAVLHEVLGLSQPATVRVVDALAARGLVERRPGRDRRTLALRLTPAGDAAATEVLEARARALDGLVAGLAAPERAALEQLLATIVASLAEDRPEAIRTCRQCDRGACAGPDGDRCPLQHTVTAAP
jgi:DNA-binding MarR family transcriptional regulator